MPRRESGQEPVPARHTRSRLYGVNRVFPEKNRAQTEHKRHYRTLRGARVWPSDHAFSRATRLHGKLCEKNRRETTRDEFCP